MSDKELNYKNIRVEDTDSYMALKNGGWNKRRLISCSDGERSEVQDPGFWEHKNRNVVIKRYDVPDFGTYKLEVTISALSHDLSDMTLFAGRRNMIERGIGIRKGEIFSISFYQAVFPYIPALTAKRLEDKAVYISIAGVDEADLDGALDVQIVREEDGRAHV